MLEHRLSNTALEHRLQITAPEYRLPKTVSEHRSPGEAQKMIRQDQIPTEVQEAPAGIRKISAGIQIENHIVNQRISRLLNRQLLQTEELAHRISEIREAEITGVETLRTEPETRLRSLAELLTGFIYHGSFREFHRTFEHRLPDKTTLEHLLPGETQEMIRQNQIQTVNRIVNRQISRQVYQQMPDRTMLKHWLPKTALEHRLISETQKMNRHNQIFADVQEAPAGIRETPAGIQTADRIVDRQINRQINQQISRQVNRQVNQQISRQLMQTEARTHRTEENLFRQIRLSVPLLNTISKRLRTNGNISAVITQTHTQRQYDIRQRDILTYNEAESMNGTLKTQAAASAQPLKYLAKEQSAGKPSGQEAFLNPIRTDLQYLKKKEMAGAEALREQKQSVKVLMEKINIQEQVIDQMKNARQGQNTALGKAEVKMVADTVLERLYKDIHLQRLRMGMS
jgi:hypothetical protein